MIGRGPRARVDPAFDRFLQAPFDEDRPERMLSVVSVLARLDLDPWHEAAVLAALAPAAAIERLEALFEKVPDCAAEPRDRAQIASRLVALLPQTKRAPVSAPSSAGQPAADEERADDGSTDPGPSRGGTRGLKLVVIVLVLISAAIATFTDAPLDVLLGFGTPDAAVATTPSLDVHQK
jgi:hypothetical protein